MWDKFRCILNQHLFPVNHFSVLLIQTKWNKTGCWSSCICPEANNYKGCCSAINLLLVLFKLFDLQKLANCFSSACMFFLLYSVNPATWQTNTILLAFSGTQTSLSYCEGSLTLWAFQLQPGCLQYFICCLEPCTLNLVGWKYVLLLSSTASSKKFLQIHSFTMVMLLDFT